MKPTLLTKIPDVDKLLLFIECCCLLGYDREAVGLLAIAESLSDSMWPPPPIHRVAAQLAAARLNYEPIRALACVQQIEAWIKRYHEWITDRGLLWPWYTYALQVVAGIDPEQGQRLYPVLVPGVRLPPLPPEAEPFDRALYRLQAYKVIEIQTIHFSWNSQEFYAFEEITFSDGNTQLAEEMGNIELLESLWDCVEELMNRGRHNVGVYRINLSERTMHFIATILDDREWEEEREPVTREDFRIQPIPEAQQDVERF